MVAAVDYYYYNDLKMKVVEEVVEKILELLVVKVEKRRAKVAQKHSKLWVESSWACKSQLWVQEVEHRIE